MTQHLQWLTRARVAGGVVWLIGVVTVTFLAQVLLVLREDARRAVCQSNLHRIGMALTNYDNAIKTLPPAWVSTNRYGWSAMFMPYFEEIAIYQPWTYDSAWDQNEPELLSWVVQPLVCPSDNGPQQLPAEVAGVVVGRANYPAVSGTVPIADEAMNVAVTGGPFGQNSSVSIARAFVNGLSHSTLVGERKTYLRKVINAGGFTTWWGVRDNDTQQGQALVIGDCAAGNLPNGKGTAPIGAYAGFSSYHPGGAYFVMADRSVRFFNEDIDPAIYANLATVQRRSDVLGF